jgi:hypothetical protein
VADTGHVLDSVRDGAAEGSKLRRRLKISTGVGPTKARLKTSLQSRSRYKHPSDMQRVRIHARNQKELRKMKTMLAPTTPTIIPAQPGYFVVSKYSDSGPRLYLDPIIAWGV